MSYYDEHGNYTIPCMEVPRVFTDRPQGAYALIPVSEHSTGTVFAHGQSSGELRARGHAYIALAEHQYREEAQEVDELDRIARDLFDIPYVSLDEGDRGAVQAVHERYTRNDDIPAVSPHE